jgi:tRNA pseudouridine38-40 synthase
MRYLLELSYKGTHYHGWQKQANVHSVQEEIEQKLSLILRSEIAILGCGRTDTGVHAKQYFAHFNSDLDLSNESLTKKLNKVLPHDIAILSLQKVADDFHARFDADYRTYEYWITQKVNPFLTEFAWLQYGGLNIEAMNEAAKLLLTHNDFECFSKVHTDVKTFLCDVTIAKWEQKDDKLIFTIRANRFLRNMVRAIVGTLIEVGKTRLTIAEFNTIIESKSRSEAGQSVPAHGLYLTEVHYPHF